VKRRQDNVFAPVADSLHHAGLHFAGGFLGECEPKNVFAEKGIVGFKQVPDAFGDYARLAGPRAGDHQQRPVTVRDRAPLRIVELQTCTFRLPHFKKSLGHRFSRLTPFAAKGKRRAI
jgi:hypothetical protein